MHVFADRLRPSSPHTSSAIALLQNPQGVGSVIETIEKLVRSLQELEISDLAKAEVAMHQALAHANGTAGASPDEYGQQTKWAFLLHRHAGHETTLWFEYLVASLLSSTCEGELFGSDALANGCGNN